MENILHPNTSIVMDGKQNEHLNYFFGIKKPCIFSNWNNIFMRSILIVPGE